MEKLGVIFEDNLRKHTNDAIGFLELAVEKEFKKGSNKSLEIKD